MAQYTGVEVRTMVVSEDFKRDRATRIIFVVRKRQLSLFLHAEKNARSESEFGMMS